MALAAALVLMLAAHGVVGILTRNGLLIGDGVEEDLSSGDITGARCAERVKRELDSMKRSAASRAGQAGGQATIDLAGYALHQPLRSAPYDMYVTEMKVKVPGQAGWVRVQKCKFNGTSHILDADLVFRDLSVTGHVKLYEGAVRVGPGLVPVGDCSMTLRLRRAGLGLSAVPAGRRSLLTDLGRLVHLNNAPPLEVRTDAHFVDPDFVSVHATGCPGPGDAAVRGSSSSPELKPHLEHRSDDLADLPPEPSQDLSHLESQAPGRALADGGDLAAEMEDVFLRGVRTLLARYMEFKLQPALRDTVLAGMGYSVSYGR